MDFRFLLDAADASGAPRRKLQIAKLGDFKDGRYGEFSITKEQVASWAANLAKMPGGRVPIDLDHGPEKGGSSEAAGWITGVSLENGVPTATVEWTPVGEKAIRDQTYLFFSPTYADNFDNETGDDIGATLIGGALTNRPFLDMPMISLSRSITSHEETSDSPAHMAELAKIAKALELPENADEATILAAVAKQGDALKETGEKVTTLEADLAEAKKETPEPTTLEKQAKDAGKVLLSQADFDGLKAGAADGVEAKKKLTQMTFDNAFDEGVKELRIAPAQKDELQALYDVAPDKTLKLMAAAPKLANGTRKSTGENEDDLPEGQVPDAVRLDRQVKAFMKEHSETDYAVALDKVLETNGAAE